MAKAARLKSDVSALLTRPEERHPECPILQSFVAGAEISYLMSFCASFFHLQNRATALSCLMLEL